MLTIKNYSKAYGDGKKAVDNISLTVESGDIFGFIGHNGAGKSSTIRAVVGVMDFSEGEITIDGHSVKSEPLACKEVTAYIPDNPDLYENLTGIQYLNFVADAFHISAKDREERMQDYANRLEITDALGDLISSYSHGMKQKVALIGALIHKPKLLVLDEPFVGLDPKAAFTLKEIMKELCEEGSAVFFSTHVLDVAEKLCNKIAIIKQGKLVASGAIEELTKDKQGMCLHIALNYGGRDEIVHAVKQIISNNTSAQDITEQTISNNLYTAGQPDPDFIIRPSGEYRLSNYLIWQSAYAEYWFSDILWPDFKPKDLEMAIEEFNHRNRRFGGL